jgi:hypothetical protein
VSTLTSKLTAENTTLRSRGKEQQELVQSLRISLRASQHEVNTLRRSLEERTRALVYWSTQVRGRVETEATPLKIEELERIARADAATAGERGATRKRDSHQDTGHTESRHDRNRPVVQRQSPLQIGKAQMLIVWLRWIQCQKGRAQTQRRSHTRWRRVNHHSFQNHWHSRCNATGQPKAVASSYELRVGVIQICLIETLQLQHWSRTHEIAPRMSLLRQVADASLLPVLWIQLIQHRCIERLHRTRQGSRFHQIVGQKKKIAHRKYLMSQLHLSPHQLGGHIQRGKSCQLYERDPLEREAPPQAVAPKSQ